MTGACFLNEDVKSHCNQSVYLGICLCILACLSWQAFFTSNDVFFYTHFKSFSLTKNPKSFFSRDKKKKTLLLLLPFFLFYFISTNTLFYNLYIDTIPFGYQKFLFFFSLIDQTSQPLRTSFARKYTLEF